ncbi:MAG: hypothetical protein MK082_04145 [Phycisphaerales bacterium]|nr:hypothetical protein [Phycisphaerales bacterium]
MIHDGNKTQHPIEWAMETDVDPIFMLANWLVRDVIETAEGAVQVTTSKDTTLDQYRTLKRIFKQLRTQGELPADRRLGARLYAASIAGALVHHDRLITAQSSDRLRTAFDDFTRDGDMPDVLIELVRKAMDKID